MLHHVCMFIKTYLHECYDLKKKAWHLDNFSNLFLFFLIISCLSATCYPCLPACLSVSCLSGLGWFGCSRWHMLCCAGVDREAPQRRFWAVIWCAGCRAWDWPATPGRLWCTARVCWREESFNTSLLSMASRMKLCTTASYRGANRF